MRKVLLVDVDSKIPNLALMQLSSFYKELGFSVDLVRLGISYYPTRRRRHTVDAKGYLLTFVSAVFRGTLSCVAVKNAVNLFYGGTGYSIKEELSLAIADADYDYSIYPSTDTSYGFLTRGCPRKCKFCVVPEKEGKIKQVAEIDDLYKHKKIKFLDNNILAFKGHKGILRELGDRKIPCQFNQGLDIRLLDEENAELLSDLFYMGEYFFAFDALKNEDKIDKKLQIFKKYVPAEWKLKFFLYCHPDMDIENDVFYRIQWCKKNKVLPYLMRHISCWDNENNDCYVDLAAWCNQPAIFKNMDLKTYIMKRQKNNLGRAKQTAALCGVVL